MKQFCSKMFCTCGRRHKNKTPGPKAGNIPKQPMPSGSLIPGEDTPLLPEDEVASPSSQQGSPAEDAPAAEAETVSSHTGTSPPMGESGNGDNDNSKVPGESHSPLLGSPGSINEPDPDTEMAAAEPAASDSGSDSSESLLYMGGGSGRTPIKMKSRKPVPGSPKGSSHNPEVPKTASGNKDIPTAQGSGSGQSTPTQSKGKRKLPVDEEFPKLGATGSSDSNPGEAKRPRLEVIRKPTENSERALDQAREAWSQITPLMLFKPTFSPLEIAAFQDRGARLQAWIADPTEPGCTIGPATLSMNDLMHAPLEKDRFFLDDFDELTQSGIDEYMGSDLGLLPAGSILRYTRIHNTVRDPTIVFQLGQGKRNEYIHAVGRGLFIAINIGRINGPQWNEVARALYEIDYPIETLRNVMFDNIVNEETAGLLWNEIYPKTISNPVELSDVGDEMHLSFEYGTAQYQQILGTQLGKAVGILVLSCFPRGTMRIARFITRMNEPSLMMRAEIEKIPSPMPASE